MNETYIIEWMTDADACAYYEGSNCYSVHEDLIEAECAEEAIAIAVERHPNCDINRSYVRTVREKEAALAAWKAELKAREEAKAEKARRKAEFAAAHPEIVAERKRKAEIAKAKKRIAEAEAELAKAKENLDYWTARLAKWEKA